MRVYAREVAFCKLYQNLFGNFDLSNFDGFENQKLDNADCEFVSRLTTFAVENSQTINEKISLLSHSFKLERIFRVDLALLQLGISEMSTCDTPKAVVINEVLELAKKFSSPKSLSFLNGILATYLKEIQ